MEFLFTFFCYEDNGKSFAGTCLNFKDKLEEKRTNRNNLPQNLFASINKKLD